MIIDLSKFIREERPYWEELSGLLDRLSRDPGGALSLDSARRLHYLYQRATADLARIVTFSSERNVRSYLQALVARAYAEIHESREKTPRVKPVHWFMATFPQTFRRHMRAFTLAILVFLAGAIFGGLATALDPDAKEALMPFSALLQSPQERVEKEEAGPNENLEGHHASFSATLWTNNTRVSIFVLALGITFGAGTLILLFYNGLILGAVAADYLMAGKAAFLMGWLAPHGAVEIPAVIVAGQAGLVLAGAMLGRDSQLAFSARLRAVGKDLVTLILGVAVLLIWAGFVEAFFSQYHEPVLPYAVKIALGALEFGLLVLFLARAGKEPQREEHAEPA